MGRVRLKKASHFAFEKLVCTTNAKLSLTKSQRGSVKFSLFSTFTPKLFENGKKACSGRFSAIFGYRESVGMTLCVPSFKLRESSVVGAG